MASWLTKKDELQTYARSIDKSIILTDKSSWFWTAIAWLLFIISFGKSDRSRFLKIFATTLGPIQAYPEGWTVNQVKSVIPHEARHTVQARRFGLFISPWVGLPFMGLAYALLPLPVGLAYFRFWLELDAERFSWEWKLQHKEITIDEIGWRATTFAYTVAGIDYLYPWPQSWALNAFDKAAEQVMGRWRSGQSK